MNRVPRRLIAGMLVLLTGLACAAGFAAPQDEPVPGDATPDVSYTLRTALTDGRLAFVGATGSIKGQVNPDLSAPEGAIVRIKLINGDGVIHDIVVPEFGADSGKVSTRGAVTTIVFKADKNGTFEYYCSLPGHKAMGMLGRLIVGEAREASADDTGTIAQDPTAVGQPVGTRAPRHVTLDLETSEVVARLADGSSYSYWTFDGKVPGPLLRVRVGDRVTVNLSNDEFSEHVHSIDLHAATGPGGAQRSRRLPRAKPGTLPSRPWHRGSMSITAPRRWSLSISPTACTA